MKLSLTIILLWLCALRCGAAIGILEWDPNSETNIAGYRVYLGVASRTYSGPIDVDNRTRWTNEFSIGDHFLAVTAYDTEGFESDLSEELFLRIVAPPVLRFESNALTWEGMGVWGLCWQTGVRTNRQIVFTNRVSLGMFSDCSFIAVRRFELGATNVLSDFSAPVFYDPPQPPGAMCIRVVLQKTSDLSEPFRDFSEIPIFDAPTNQAFFRARMEITRTGPRIR